MIDEVAESFDGRQRDGDRLMSSEDQSLPEDVQVVETKTKRDLYDQLEDLQESIKRMELGRESPETTETPGAFGPRVDGVRWRRVHSGGLCAGEPAGCTTHSWTGDLYP